MFGVLDRVDLTDAMISTTLEAEDASAVWVAGQAANSYALGDLRHRVQTHSVYERIKTETVTTAENTPPEADDTHWKRMRPTNRGAAFDIYTNTRTRAAGSLTLTLRPGRMVTVVYTGGLKALTSRVQVAPFGSPDAVLDTGVRNMDQAMRDRWSLYWMSQPLLADDDLLLGVLPCLDPVITIELTHTDQVELGIVQVGTFVRLGETEWDAGAGPVDNSFYNFRADGSIEWMPRDPSRTMSGIVHVDARDARMVDKTVSRQVGRPFLYVGSHLPEHSALRVFGFLQMQQQQLLRFKNPKDCSLPFTVVGS